VIRRALFSVFVLISLVTSVPLASAHTVLISSDPVANSTVTHLPEQVTLTFADSLLVLGSHNLNQVQVVDPTGLAITSSDNVVRGAVLTNVLTPKALKPGVYHVNFRVVAQDGHVITGAFNFNLGKVAKPASAPGPTPTGIFHLAAFANGSGVMDGTGAVHQNARITMDLDFTTREVCYQIMTSIPDVLAIHIHSMNQTNMSISDEIFFPISLSGINSRKPVCETVPVSDLTSLYYQANRFTVMLHTKTFPSGAVAGQLTRVTSATHSSGILVKGATLTAAGVGGSTAISLSLTNNQGTKILLTDISSPIASSSLIFYDANMCQGNNAMMPLQNIAVSSGNTQLLGYKYQGATLSGLSRTLKIGEKDPLTVEWTDADGVPQTLQVLANVVAPPKGLDLSTTKMAAMPGMPH